MKLFAASAAALATALVFGPPRITVTQVQGTPPVTGAVLLVEAHHHTDEPQDVSARAISLRNGQEVSKPLTLARYGEAGHYAVTKQWDAGTAYVLVFTIKQGDHAQFGTAESVVKVDAAGKIVGIEQVMEKNWRGDRYPRAATAAEISAALRSLGDN